MANLVIPELEALAADLSRASWVQVYYLDEQGVQRRVCYDQGWMDEDIRIVMRPHLVVTHHVQDGSSLDEVETVEIPLERVLLSKVSESESGAWEDAQDTLWVTGPHGQLLRLVP